MFRTINTLRNKNNNFVTLFRCPEYSVPNILSTVIRWQCTETKNENDHSPVLYSKLRNPRRATRPGHYSISNSANFYNDAYLAGPRRSANVDEIVNAVLSSQNELEKLPSFHHMTCDDLISMLIAFDDAGLHFHCRIMQTLIVEITDRLKNDSHTAPLHAMANFAIFANNNRYKMDKHLMCLNIIAPLLQHLAFCDNLEEMHHITVCLTNLNRIVTAGSMKLYKSKLQQLMDNGQLNYDSDSMIILKILRFLNHAPWSLNNGKSFRSVLELLGSRIEQLADHELADVLAMQQFHYEPGKIVAPIAQLAEKRIQQITAANNINMHLLYCCSMTEIPENGERIINCLDAYMDTTTNDTINDSFLFQILRTNKQSATKVYDKYWSKVTAELAAMDPERTFNFDNMLIKACHRYCNFDNSQRGQYRYLPFEAIATKLAFNEVNTGISGMIPRRFVKLASFLLGYGCHQTSHRFPESFVQRIEDMSPQYTVHDLTHLSRGIKLYYRSGNYKPKKSMTSRMNDDFSNQMCRIENVLDKNTIIYMTSQFTTVITLNKLLYIYSSSKMPFRSTIFKKLIKIFEEEISTANLVLSSRIIRDITNNFSQINCMVPMLCDQIMRYLYENRSMVCGDIVGRTLYILFTLGYEPANDLLMLNDEQETGPQQEPIQFDDFGAIIERDFELIAGLTIVRSCLALAFYRALSFELIDKVFNLDFLMRLEKEITICYVNAPYSTRSLNCIMQLNRAVCFGYPEARIPWFQQNYIEAHISSIVPKNLKFHNDILKMLLSITGDKSLIEFNHITPYGYRIPFVLYFNSNKEIVRPPIQKETQELRKFAIIPLENYSYCFNVNVPRGEEQLEERHLGILGFDVIQICYRDWNKMHMNLPGAKETFLRKILKTI